MSRTARCIVIALAGFSLWFGAILATGIAMGGDFAAMQTVLRPSTLAVFLVVGGMISGSAAALIGAPRYEFRSPCRELCIGAIFGGVVPSMGLAGPDASSLARTGALVLGTSVFFLFEVFGYRLAARMRSDREVNECR